MKRILIWFVNIFMKLISKIEFKNLDNIPDDRPLVLAANHIGFFDAFVMVTIKKVMNDKNLVVIVAEKYKNSKFFNWAVEILGFMFVDRYNSDVKTLKAVIRKMNNDGLLCIAPEGTRSPDGQMLKAQNGAVYIAAKTRAIIVPLAATGCMDSQIKENLWKKRLNITIEFGEPYEVPEIPRKNREEFLNGQTDELMCRIGSMLPPSYRGYYADYPRLKELLKEKE